MSSRLKEAQYGKNSKENKQEVNEVLPEAVDTARDGDWGVGYTLLIPLLIEAVKELSAEVDKLKGDA